MPEAVANLITLTCPTCGAKLKLKDGIHLLVCASCGNEHMVHRDGGAIYLAPIAQDVKHIRVGVDKTAAELAIPRLRKEIEALDERITTVRKHSYAYKVDSSARASARHSTLGWGALMAFVASAFLGASGYVLAGIIAVFAFFVLFVWYAIENSKRFTQISRSKQIEIDNLESQRAEKVAALERNHQIANS